MGVAGKGGGPVIVTFGGGLEGRRGVDIRRGEG